MPHVRRNSRMRKLASHLSVIRILLNPPSPPSSEPDSPDIPISPNCNRRNTGISLCSVTSPPYLDAPPNHLSTTANAYHQGSSNSGCFLQVPQRLDMMPEDQRIFSPPPRRCSNSSAYSEHSTISDSNLLSPAMYSNSTRSNSFASASYSYSDDNETPPNEFLNVPFMRPHSTQV